MTTPTTPARPSRVEVHVPVDTADAPYGWTDRNQIIIEAALADDGLLELTLPLDQAREWAAELFAAVTLAHRETTGDPHALTDEELAGLADPHSYEPASTLHLVGTNDAPARMRFIIAIDIAGLSLADGPLRAGLVEQLATRFNTTRVAVSNGHPING
ncbi:MAG: hypothetical protein WBA45_03130 [Microthrixaceae bacterium]